jgi:DNA-directed RNA polymerase specialized sigma subunit
MNYTNNWNPYKQYPKIFKQSKLTCTKFFNNRRDTFQSFSISIEDLEQEVNLALLGTLEKFAEKPEEDLLKLCNKLIFWKLCVLLRDVKIGVSREQTHGQRYDDTSFKETPNITFDGLKDKMTDRQYYIIYEIIVNKKRATEIAEELNISRQWVNVLYRRGLARAKILMKL